MNDVATISLSALASPVEVNGQPLDLASLPAKSISALVSRGLSHYFGSEQASRVKNLKDAYLEEHKTEMAEDEITALKAERFEIAMKALVDGTIGSRAVGITIDPIEKIKTAIARSQVTDILKANGIKVPKGEEAVEFADGNKKTMEEMIKTRLEVNGEAIDKEAAKVLKAKQSAKAAAEALAKSVEKKDAASLGL